MGTRGRLWLLLTNREFEKHVLAQTAVRSLFSPIFHHLNRALKSALWEIALFEYSKNHRPNGGFVLSVQTVLVCRHHLPRSCLPALLALSYYYCFALVSHLGLLALALALTFLAFLIFKVGFASATLSRSTPPPYPLYPLPPLDNCCSFLSRHPRNSLATLWSESVMNSSTSPSSGVSPPGGTRLPPDVVEGILGPILVRSLSPSHFLSPLVLPCPKFCGVRIGSSVHWSLIVTLTASCVMYRSGRSSAYGFTALCYCNAVSPLSCSSQ